MDGTIKDMYYRDVELGEFRVTDDNLGNIKRDGKTLGHLYKVLGQVGDDHYCLSLLSSVAEGAEETGIVKMYPSYYLETGYLYETLSDSIAHLEELEEMYGKAPTGPL